LVGSKREKVWNLKSMELEAARTLCGGLTATPNKLEEQGIDVTMDGKHRNVFEILRYPNVTWDRLTQIWPQMAEIRPAIAEQIQIDALYAGYIERQEADINAFRKDEGLVLPDTLNYDSIGSLSTEIKNRLKQVRPTTLGAAARIPGVTPAAIIALLRHVKKKTVELVETDAA
ncbi:MAG TPA: tRNA uridine-5-carboxymethylaminomethyl(34) synthesis enzyme MnmG, partial [Alphaproteobacteria bacterium]